MRPGTTPGVSEMQRPPDNLVKKESEMRYVQTFAFFLAAIVLLGYNETIAEAPIRPSSRFPTPAYTAPGPPDSSTLKPDTKTFSDHNEIGIALEGIRSLEKKEDESLKNSLRNMVDAWAKRNISQFQQQADSVAENGAASKKRQEVLIELYEWERQKIDWVKAALRWGHVTSYITCAFAHILLIVGLWAAVREFHDAHITRKLARQENVELKLSMHGVAIKTSLVGMVILVVSLVFYFLYLKFVYPITAIPG